MFSFAVLVAALKIQTFDVFLLTLASVKHIKIIIFKNSVQLFGFSSTTHYRFQIFPFRLLKFHSQYSQMVVTDFKNGDNAHLYQIFYIWHGFRCSFSFQQSGLLHVVLIDKQIRLQKRSNREAALLCVNTTESKEKEAITLGNRKVKTKD